MLTMQQARDMRQGITLSGDRNQCSECGLLFNSSGAFDKHRTGRIGVYEGPEARRCLSPSEMRLTGMAVNPAGFWVKALMTEEERERAKAGIDSDLLQVELEASGRPSEVVGQREAPASPS
ncbi:hypothetical protein AWB80_02872 [Caballeronia pedi]|uniref:C2H2-type domain-containing protein n=1 Tax=Caballeronia pedi TaxID=1777141 RepID=A0A158B0Q3_9BURK|nr:hypothetical protein AWB80_02872 [Caballeronia pedi]